jgi:SNF2 family DNA or RNA helicase
MAHRTVIKTNITHAELFKPVRLSEFDVLNVDFDPGGDGEADEFVLRVGTAETFASNSARHVFFARFPERREVAGSQSCVWRVPCTDVSVRVIETLWTESVVFTENARLVYEALRVKLAFQSVAMDRSKEYHDYARLREVITTLAIPTPPIVTPYSLGNGHAPMLHQSVAHANSMSNPGYGLFMEQGTGKTNVVIGRIDSESERWDKDVYRALVVCPKNVQANWANELREFSRVDGEVTILRGLTMDRVKLLLGALGRKRETQRYTVFVCSYEMLVNMWDYLQAIIWDLAILDEGHYIKAPDVRRHEYAMRLRDRSRQRMILTGTPVCNTPLDLYAPFEFLEKGGSGFTSWSAFRQFYGVYEIREGGHKALVDVQNLPFMQERLARMAFVCRKAEALPDLPLKMYDVCEVEMTSEQAKCYERVSRALIEEIERDIAEAGDRRIVNVNNILTKLLRLAQVTSGFMTYEVPRETPSGEFCEFDKAIDRFDPNPKLEALVELLKDPEKTPYDKTIVWACWVQDIKTIAARLAIEGIKAVTFYGATSEEARAEAVRAYNEDPETRVFVGNPGCGGVGINLLGYPTGRPELAQTNTTHEVYFSQDWSSPKRSQSEDRACRKGQRLPVRITDLCVPKTIDEEIRARVLNKRMVALKIQDLQDVLTRLMDVGRVS